MDIEKEIVELELTAPRVTPERIKEVIVSAKYHLFPNTTVTICLLLLKNGFSVTGESACASSSNFNELLGQKIARENAEHKIWALEGYLLKDKLSNRESVMNESDRPVLA